mgnify:CR=1 FL=1
MALLALGVLPLLAGCKNSSSSASPFIINQLYKHNIENTTVKIPNLPLPFIKDAPDSADLGPGVNLIDTNINLHRPVESVEKDFIAKADVYWKLNWMAKVMSQGFVPHDFGTTLEKTKGLLALTFHDSVYRLAVNALEEVEEGLKHQQEEDVLTSAGVNSIMIPWTAGTLAVEDFIERGSLGFGGKPLEQQQVGFVDPNAATAPATPTMVFLTNEQKSALEVIRTYTSKYKASPATMKTRIWSQANQKIDAFLLALRRHPASADHPGLDQARLRTTPMGEDYYVQPDMTAGYKPSNASKNPYNITTPFNPTGSPFKE